MLGRQNMWLAYNDALEDRYKVFNVDEGVLAAINFKGLKCFHNKLPEIFPPLLAVVDSVSQVVYTLHMGWW